MQKIKTTIKPFVKWAGGKTQLINDIKSKYPSEISCYCEPFVGGGAVLFDVLSNFKPTKILINDINKELINTYLQVQNNASKLITILSDLQNFFWNKTNEERTKMYLSKRELFNNLKLNINDDINIEKASLFIFLNKTCFNGLYRVNKKGAFNVPMGSYRKPIICDDNNLLAVSRVLQDVSINCGDFIECTNFINENTFVYIDPPYRPLTQTACFTAYNESIFTDMEQIRLSKFVDNIHEKGAKVVLSNSDPKHINQNDNFFDELYRKYTIQRVSARRMINCNANSRGAIKEILVSNF